MDILLLELGENADQSERGDSVDDERDDFKAVMGLLADGHEDGVQTE